MKPMVANITNGYDVLPLPRKNSTNYVKTLKKKNVTCLKAYNTTTNNNNDKHMQDITNNKVCDIKYVKCV